MKRSALLFNEATPYVVELYSNTGSIPGFEPWELSFQRSDSKEGTDSLTDCGYGFVFVQKSRSLVFVNLYFSRANLVGLKVVSARWNYLVKNCAGNSKHKCRSTLFLVEAQRSALNLSGG